MVPPPAGPGEEVAVAAEASIAVFRAAFQRWIEEERPLADLVREGFADLDRFLRERR